MWEVAAQNPLKCKRTMPRPRQLDMNTLTAAPKHAELVAVLRGLHMATGASQGVIITGTDLTLVTLHSFTWIYMSLRPHTSLRLSRRLVPGAAVTSQCGDTLGCQVSANHLVAVWLLRNIGTTCCTWRQFSGRWWLSPTTHQKSHYS